MEFMKDTLSVTLLAALGAAIFDGIGLFNIFPLYCIFVLVLNLFFHILERFCNSKKCLLSRNYSLQDHTSTDQNLGGATFFWIDECKIFTFSYIQIWLGSSVRMSCGFPSAALVSKSDYLAFICLNNFSPPLLPSFDQMLYGHENCNCCL